MKKIFGLILCISVFTVAAVAQPRAIGGRIGYGFDVSYQHGFGEKNMLQLDAGLTGFWGGEVVVTYNWVFGINSWKEKGNWNWYAGVGGGVGGYWGLADYGGMGSVGVAGMIGVEYNFWFPMQMSIDYRPVIGPYFNAGGVGFNMWGIYASAICWSIRYKF